MINTNTTTMIKPFHLTPEQAETIRKKCKEQNKTLTSLAYYIGVDLPYLCNMLSGRFLYSKNAIKKTQEYLQLEPLFFNFVDIDGLIAENKSLKQTLNQYEKMIYIYEHFEEIQAIKDFINKNIDMLQKMQGLDYKKIIGE